MAYSLLSEPFYGFTKNDCNDKILIGNWVNEMYYTIKRKDPNHLITIGLQHPETVINWDYGMMMVDFMSLHLYAWSEDPNYSSRMIWKYYKFLSNNYNFPWVISETGFSGTDITSNQDNHTGSEEDQLDFANDNIQRSQDCGCKGYGWWGHQDIGYGSNWEENLGFITRWPEQREKKARGAFANMQNIIPNTGNCVTPEKYLNIDEGTVWKLTGYVKDENGSPIKDALIFGTNGNVRVLADEQGKFKLYTNGSDYGGLWISAIGYELQVPKTITNNQTYTLKKINKNQWTKRFTNNNSNTLLDWTFNDYDRFLPCDFDGDGKDELLCIQFNNPERNKVNIYSFDNGKWINTWDNDGNNSFGGWSVKSFDKYLVGDFDGDGKDELQCLQLTPGYHNWSTTLRFINNEWSCPYSNSGTSSSFAGWWLNINDDFVVGDFNGDQKDEILCYQKNDDVDCFATMLYFENSDWKFGPSNNGNDWIGEWRLSSTDIIKAGNFDEDKADELICTQIGGLNDWITIQNFDNNTWNRLWSNEARNTEPIYFYRSNLVIGNFDFDDKDEILGINKSSAAKFDFVNPSLNSEWNIRNSTLSDWTINPKANCFFMHTIEKAPDYFFVIEKNKNQNYSGEMFSLNNLIQGNTSSLRSENVSINNRISDKDSSKADLGYVNKFNVKVFPNPTKGEVNIQAENGTINLIEVYNYQGQVLYEKSYNSETSIFIDISNFPNAIYLLKITNSESGITCNQLILNTTSK